MQEATQFKVGDYVYHRGSDLFGNIESIEGETATVKYGWPMSDGAPPREVPLSDLMTPSQAADLAR